MVKYVSIREEALGETQHDVERPESAWSHIQAWLFLNATFCIYLSFSAVLGLCATHGLSLVVVCGLFTEVSSLAVEHKLKGARAP